MDDARFDTLARLLGMGASRRRMLAASLMAMPAVLGVDGVLAKKKHCKGKTKPCGKRCIPKTSCCTDTDCKASKRCVNGTCRCTPHCSGKKCGSDGCGGTCGSCTGTDVCSSDGQCVSCDACKNWSCPGDQCVCPFDAGCSPSQCCSNGQTCLSGACGACPATPDPCTTEVVCGQTTAENPGCYCVTSVDDVTTCTSVFVNLNQGGDCASDADCIGLLGPGVDLVCVNLPCFFDELGFSKVCVNKGCEDLSAPRSRSHSDKNASSIRQLDLRPRH